MEKCLQGMKPARVRMRGRHDEREARAKEGLGQSFQWDTGANNLVRKVRAKPLKLKGFQH